VTTTRLLWLAGAALALVLCTLAAALIPVRIQISLGAQGDTARAAAPLSLPTTTPAPPTEVPPTATPEPPREERRRPTITPTPPPATAVPEPPAPPAQVQIVKRASSATALPGDRLSYTLTVTNQGQGAAHDVVVTDEVPRPLQVIDLQSSKGDIVVEGRRVTAYPRTLAPGETQTYTIVAQLPDGAAPGPLANTAIIITTTGGDDPGDNTSTTIVEVLPPLTKQSAPPRLPTTASPLDPEARPFLAIYWPLLALGLGLLAFGGAARVGAFRQRTLRVTVGALPPAADAGERAELGGLAVGIQLDPHELAARWRGGASTPELVALVARRNSQADRLAVSIAVQRVLQAEVGRATDR
jgi:uncharacterized repeat protein (TIGR01451 family)